MISEICGKVREVPATGGKERNSGAVPVGLLGGPCGPRSNCSQLNVSGSPLGSDPEPFNVNGVLIGIIYPLGPAFTVGTPLPVLVTTGQPLPPPVVLNETIC